MFDIDWHAMWVPAKPLLDLILRGSIVYLVLFVYFRLLRREAGNLGVTDVLFVVLVADASQQAMAHEYESVTEGLVLVGTLAFWDLLLNWLAYRYRWAEKLIEPPPVQMIRDGKLIRRNMRRELITEDELMSALRQQGITQLDAVAACTLESDGEFSVIRADGEKPERPKRRKKV